MNANPNVERLLPSLYAFLSADPAPSRLVGASPTSPSQTPTSPSATGPSDAFAHAQCIVDSYERWRRCIAVWRRVIGNDALFLTLLLHAGCLWSPDYAALHALAKTRSHAHGRTRAVAAAAATAPPFDSGSTAKRRGKRGGPPTAEAVAQAAQAAQAADHQRMADACPASMWALHVLHFLCVEEIYAVPSLLRAGERSGLATVVKSGTSEDEEASDAATSSDAATDSVSASSGSSVGENEDEDGDVDVTDGASLSKTRGGGGGEEMARASKRRRSHTHSKRATVDRHLQKGRPSHNRKRIEFEDAARSALSPASPASSSFPPSYSSAYSSSRQLAASSSLLPKTNFKHRSSKKELQHHLDISLAVLRQEHAEREGRRRGVRNEIKPLRRFDDWDDLKDVEKAKNAATTPADPAAEAMSPSVRADALLLRATVSLVSEEEPLVQQVAAALMEDWLDLLTPSPSFSSSAAASTGTAVKEEDAGRRTPVDAAAVAHGTVQRPTQSHDGSAQQQETSMGCGVPCSNRANLSGSRSFPRTRHPADVSSPNSEINADAAALLLQQEQQQREARHYWLSCLMKLVAFLDGMHSALREENPHVAAVMARQGIAPHEAEDIFTKSLPAIFNCVLVEEVLQTSYAHPSLSAPYAAPRLWMPPPVLLLPFHVLARGSRIGVWVPTAGTPTEVDGTVAAAVPSAASSSRTSGRFVMYVVDSYGPHLRTSSGTAGEGGVGVEKMAESGGASLSAGRSRRQHEVDAKNTVEGGEGAMGCTNSRLVFGLRAAEPEVLLEQRCRPWVNALLPLLRSSASSTAKSTADQREDADSDPQTPLRLWGCTQASTAGCPRVDLYVARTLVMLPIPAQSASDSTSNSTGTAQATNGGGNTAAPTRADNSDKNNAMAQQPRRGGGRWRHKQVTLSPEEAAVRRRHPQLCSALQQHLRRRSSSSNAPVFTPFGTRSGSGGASISSDPAQLILLYGLARGEEATALRHMGFSVRTGSHHGLGRGGGPAGGMVGADAAVGASSSHLEDSSASNGSSSKGSSGRLTLARDALGTTLEGLYLVARRVMSLKGLYATAGVAAASGRGKGALRYTGEAAVSAVFGSDLARISFPGDSAGGGVVKGGEGSRRYGGKGSAASGDVGGEASIAFDAVAAAAITGKGGGREGEGTRTGAVLSPSQESEVLGTAAATLVLTALFLSHNLMDELLEQPTLVLWTTELASYVVDVSLLLSRPIPRLLKADGFALALLLQPAQSLLLMVGLVSTLVAREAAHAEMGSGTLPCPSSSSSLPSRAPVWHPWWTLFRSTVLRDTTLPSCMYGGVWALVAKAEEAVALAAAQARWAASGHVQASAAGSRRRNTENTKAELEGGGAAKGNERASAEAMSASAGGRSSSSAGSKNSSGRRGAWASGRRLLRLSGPIALSGTAATSPSSSSSTAGNATEGFMRQEEGGAAVTTATSSLPPSSTAAAAPAPSRHRLRLLPHPSTSAAAAPHYGASPSAVQPAAPPLCLCGPAVLDQSPFSPDAAGGSQPSSLVRVGQLRVVTGAELSFLMEKRSPWTAQLDGTSRFVLSRGQHEPSARWPSAPHAERDAQSSAAASALWLSLEATCLQWPSPATEQ